MSADAKLWATDTGEWRAVHDGPCARVPQHGTETANETPWDLSRLLVEVETCMGQPLRWEFRTYPDGRVGLVGWYA